MLPKIDKALDLVESRGRPLFGSPGVYRGAHDMSVQSAALRNLYTLSQAPVTGSVVQQEKHKQDARLVQASYDSLSSGKVTDSKIHDYVSAVTDLAVDANGGVELNAGQVSDLKAGLGDALRHLGLSDAAIADAVNEISYTDQVIPTLNPDTASSSSLGARSPPADIEVPTFGSDGNPLKDPSHP